MTATRFALQYAHRQWRGMSALSAIMVAEVALAALTPWPMKWLVDDLLAPTHRPHLIALCASATVALFAAGALLSLVQTTVSITVGQGLTYAVSADLFAHLQRLSLRFHGRRSVGDSLRRVTSDCGCVTTLVRDCGLPMAASALTLLVMAAVAFWLSWQLTLLSIVVMPFMAPLFWKLGGPIADRAYAYGEAEGHGYELVERVLSAIPAMQAFNRVTANDRSLSANCDATLAAALSANTAQMKLRIATGLITAIGSAAVVYVGATQVMAGTLSVGSLLVFLAYLASVYGPLESIVDGGRHVLDAAGSARRVIEVFDLDHGVTEPAGARPFTAATGHVVFDGVTFGYDPGRPVLTGLSLHVPPRRDRRPRRRQRGRQDHARLAAPPPLRPLVRPSLDRWPRRPHPALGRPPPDRRPRAPAAVPVPHQHRRQRRLRPAGRIPRRRGARRPPPPPPTTSSAGCPTATTPSSASAARRSRSANGSASPSPGRCCSTRRLLVLDEPTSALDAETESTVVDALRAAGGRSRTTLVIAHKLSTVRAADRIAVLAGGRIVAVGPHEQLLLESSHYAELCHHQLSGPLAPGSARVGAP